MAIRTTDAAVRGIIETVVTTSLVPFMTAANELVTERCASALNTNGSPYYSDVRLELIERWLSAHFYTNLDPRATREKISSISESFQSKVDLNLATSHYGQTAMILDTKGGLARLNEDIKKGIKRIDARIEWLGTKRRRRYPLTPIPWWW
jgi:hypothetical protein